jgi:hypothetical protein
MGKAKVRYVAVGVCPSCRKEFVRPPSCSHAICDCSSIIEVPLHPALILPERLYAKIKHVTDLAEVTVEALVNKMLEVAVKEKLKEMEIERS